MTRNANRGLNDLYAFTCAFTTRRREATARVSFDQSRLSIRDDDMSLIESFVSIEKAGEGRETRLAARYYATWKETDWISIAISVSFGMTFPGERFLERRRIRLEIRRRSTV